MKWTNIPKRHVMKSRCWTESGAAGGAGSGGVSDAASDARQDDRTSSGRTRGFFMGVGFNGVPGGLPAFARDCGDCKEEGSQRVGCP